MHKELTDVKVNVDVKEKGFESKCANQENCKSNT